MKEEATGNGQQAADWTDEALLELLYGFTAEQLPHLGSVMRQGERTVATNGHIIVWMDRVLDVQPELSEPRMGDGKLWMGGKAMIERHAARRASMEWVPIPECALAHVGADGKCKCSNCSGRGTLGLKDSAGFDYWVPCSACGGNGQHHEPVFWMPDVRVSAHYVLWLLRLPGMLAGIPAGGWVMPAARRRLEDRKSSDNETVHFRWAFGGAMLAPCMRVSGIDWESNEPVQKRPVFGWEENN